MNGRLEDLRKALKYVLLILDLWLSALVKDWLGYMSGFLPLSEYV